MARLALDASSINLPPLSRLQLFRCIKIRVNAHAVVEQVNWLQFMYHFHKPLPLPVLKTLAFDQPQSID